MEYVWLVIWGAKYEPCAPVSAHATQKLALAACNELQWESGKLWHVEYFGDHTMTYVCMNDVEEITIARMEVKHD